MKLREMAKLLRTASGSSSEVERALALNCLMVPLVKAYASKYGTDEKEAMQELLHSILELESC